MGHPMNKTAKIVLVAAAALLAAWMVGSFVVGARRGYLAERDGLLERAVVRAERELGEIRKNPDAVANARADLLLLAQQLKKLNENQSQARADLRKRAEAVAAEFENLGKPQ